MAISVGTRLGPYEILTPLGQGGMGEVYRAKDPRLGRDVAIKVLPEAVASDQERLSRFEQEARSASALNHPNIVTIYEIGTAGSLSYISMELVQGRTLRELVAEGPLPAKRLLSLSAQIAEALARAHEVGIVHRDLKPENLMVTREGLVKVLDFGLAKLVLPASGEVSAMPTLARPETHPGIVLGTVLWPLFLPDGRRFLYLGGHGDREGAGVANLSVASLDSKEDRAVGRLESRFEYVPPGFLLYAREGALFAQPFDERAAKARGEPHLLVPNVHYFYGPRHAAFSASRTGVLAYQTAARPSRLVWFDRGGKETGQLGEPAVVKGGLRISPDGARAAVDIENATTGTSDVWVFEPARGVATRLHSDPVDEVMPVWSPDGSWVLYRSDRHGPPDIYEIAIGVPGSEKPVLELPGVQQPEDVSGDGRLLAYLNEVATTTWNIWLLPLKGERKPRVWAPTRFNQSSPRFSPDGRWIAFESDESGDLEVYVALTEGGAEKRRISPAGGRFPRWRRDGRELYYVTSTGSLMAVSVHLGPKWEAGVPAPLFRVEPEIQNYDVTPDGTRFLVSLPLEKSRESPLRVIVNWPAMLEGRR